MQYKSKKAFDADKNLKTKTRCGLIRIRKGDRFIFSCSSLQFFEQSIWRKDMSEI